MEANIKINPTGGGYQLQAQRIGGRVNIGIQGDSVSWNVDLTLTETQKLISGLQLMLPADQRVLP